MIDYKFIFKIILIIIAFVILFPISHFFLSIRPIKFYTPTTPKDYNLEYENVSFVTSDKIKISAWLITSKTANTTVIAGHGYPFNKGNILPVIKFLHPNYNLLLYDHRYFGESKGFITTVGLKEIKDVEAAIKFIQDKFPKKQIALFGFSLSASAMLMSKANVSAIIVDSPYANLENIIKNIYSIFGPLKYPMTFVTNTLSLIFFKTHPKKVAPELSVRDLNIPIFLIHGEKDIQFPVENAYAIKKNNPKHIELWIVPNANHGESYFLAKNEYEKLVKTFLNKHVK